MEDWTYNPKSTERHLDYENEFQWDRSSSEPNLSDSNPGLGRWSKRLLHEYISIDELKFFRRKNPLDIHTRSNICLYNKNEPITSFASLKTEYRRRFKKPLLILRPILMRKRTTLKLEGQMGTTTEHKSNYLPYSEEEILKCRPSPTKNPEHLKLCGEFEFLPEYRSSFREHPLTERSLIIPPRGSFNIEDIFDVKKEIGTRSEPSLLNKTGQSQLESTLAATKTTTVTTAKPKIDSKICHLKLEGEMDYVPEYRSKFVEFPIEKSQSIPQLSNIKFKGRFNVIPEYRENFKFYDCYSKSAPIKKDDNINFFCDKFVTVPEYREKFKKPDKTAISKTVSLKTEDNLKTIKGEFQKILPEYYESFKDPQIKEKPERGKCREPYLRLKGKIEFNPEYRSTYLNYPRSRPITKKSTSSIRLSNSRTTPSSGITTPRRKFSITSTTPKITDPDPNQEVPFTCQPEYRKAKREYLIKERPLTRKITENDGTEKIISKNYNQSNTTESSTGKKIQKQQHRLQQQQHHKGQIPLSTVNTTRTRDISPQLRLNIEDFDKKIHKLSPRYGRRASVRATNHNVAREKTKVIECNPKYSSTSNNNSRRNSNVSHYHQQPPLPQSPSQPLSTSQRKYSNDGSFIILDEPCKKSAWMKKSWYEP